LLQTAAQKTLGLTEPHKHYNYTCDQCYRMIHSLQGMCKATNGESKKYEQQFQKQCADDILPVSYGEGPDRRDGKCGMFYTFVKELYCPYDPCTQVTIQSNKAHKAVCGLLRCAGPEAPLGPPPPRVQQDAPLTCPEYVDDIVMGCEDLNQKAAEDPTVEEVCAKHSTHFRARAARLWQSACRN